MVVLTLLAMKRKNLISLTYDFTQDGTNNQVLANTAAASEKSKRCRRSVTLELSK